MKKIWKRKFKLFITVQLQKNHFYNKNLFKSNIVARIIKKKLGFDLNNNYFKSLAINLKDQYKNFKVNFLECPFE
jgi:hypothetical protein